MARSGPSLNDGTSIPAIGFGTGTGLSRSECTDQIVSALKAGYRHLDTAQGYFNAGSVGAAIKKWDGGKREDVYVVTKFGFDTAKEDELDPRKALEDQLKLMELDYVDLYLIHSPLFAKPSFGECWKVMEALKKEGLTRSIGVSNFREEDLREMKKSWTIPPAVNQIEYNPYVFHSPNMLRLRALLDAEDIKIEAYGPLNSLFRVTGGPVDAVVKSLAEKHGATEAQVLLSWAAKHSGGIAVTQSKNEGRQREQLDALSKADMSEEEVEQIAEAGRGKFFRHFQRGVWDAAKP
ncbi:NADP-dependent oxidoreductase domain-containing protein [Dioszegia hungarica]|uniref:NADP-dependent oxidoreductase domain-containing protein n=1 Tax=Dioszegia hungarica TaxID=4972 RepID=A0AA38H0X6_9TREE|nr:NADP-dependent oxidoreductase domain-containing protein [Dioszegia hungarica]KAI9632403.1 NADP-dependent oxidoreductase domain-containing protein [Dioszegia hungarica]